MATSNKTQHPKSKKKHHRSTPTRNPDKILHPKDGGHTHSPHFAAFGTAQTAVKVRATLTHQKTKYPFVGNTVLQPTTDTGFWIVQFILNCVLEGDLYDLTVVDDETGDEIGTSKGISIAEGLGRISITYPQPSDTPGQDFASYGTSDVLGTMQGSFNNVLYNVNQVAGPPDWVLHCMTNGVAGKSTTLTVSQPTGTPTVPTPVPVTFTFGNN